jgi:fructose-1,6-bisphosphatase/sedoheptulose 1,7-bisphosphatase-like protein
MGIKDPNKIYDTDDLAPGKKIIFAATGVTDGALLKACGSLAPASERIRW